MVQLRRDISAARCVPVTDHQWRTILVDADLAAKWERFAGFRTRLYETARPLIGNPAVLIHGFLDEALSLVAMLERVGWFDPGNNLDGAFRALANSAHRAILATLEDLDGRPSEAGETGLGNAAQAAADSLRAMAIGSARPEAPTAAVLRAFGLDSEVRIAPGLTAPAALRAHFGADVAAMEEVARRVLAHLLEPEAAYTPDPSRLVLRLLGTERPLIAHTAALWGDRAVRAAWQVRPQDVAEAVAFEMQSVPQMHSTHLGIVQALRELQAAGTDPHLRLRAAGRFYVQVAEGPVRRAALSLLSMAGRVPPGQLLTLSVASDRLRSLVNEPLAELFGSVLDAARRNASAHEQLWWDPETEREMWGNERVEQDGILRAAFAGRSVGEGWQAAVSLACGHQPGLRAAVDGRVGPAPAVERDMRTAEALAAHGVAVERVRRSRTRLAITVQRLDVETLAHVALGLLVCADAEPEVAAWVLDDLDGRPEMTVTRAALNVTPGLSSDRGPLRVPVALTALVCGARLSDGAKPDRVAGEAARLVLAQVLGEVDRLWAAAAAGDHEAATDLKAELRACGPALRAAWSLLPDPPEGELAHLSMETHALPALPPPSFASEDAWARIVSSLRQRWQTLPEARLPWLAPVESARP